MTDCSASKGGCPCAHLAPGGTGKSWELRCACLLEALEGSELHAAAALGDVKGVLRELGTVPVDQCDQLGSSALHFAAAHQHEDVVRLLLERGASPDARSVLGFTPLHACCSQPGGPGAVAVLELLLGAGADVGALTLPESDVELPALAGDTPLTLAAQHAFPGAGAAPFIACLLAAGADALLPSPQCGTSALEFACAAGDASVVRLLLEAAPASEWYRRDAGFNISYCLRLAVAYECIDVVALLLDPPLSIRGIMMQAGTDPTSVLTNEGSSSSLSSEPSYLSASGVDIFETLVLDAALADAVRLGNLGLVRLLVASGASANGHSVTPRLFELYIAHMQQLAYEHRFPRLHKLDRMRNYFDTPLTLALTGGYDDIAVWLLKRADPQPMPDGQNRTALHWSVLAGKLEVVRLLLESRWYLEEYESGRLIDRRDADSWSALAIALHYRNADAVELLVRHGASVNLPVYTREGCEMWPLHKGLLLLKDGTAESLEILAILLEGGARVDSQALKLAMDLDLPASTVQLLLHACGEEC